jgi:hypothetical protein
MPNVYLLNIVSTILKFTSRLQMNVIILLAFSYSYLNLILILVKNIAFIFHACNSYSYPRIVLAVSL